MVGIKGNVGPKFVRMQEFHKLLFYIVYGYEGSLQLNQEEAWKQIAESLPNDFSKEDFDEYPKVYLAEMSWRYV